MEYQKQADDIVNKYQDIIAAYGYGSAFSHQSGYTKDTKKIIDLIFVVQDIKKWNKKNFIINKGDYTKYTKAIFKVAPKKMLMLGTNTIYNIVKDNGEIKYKYGLVEEDSLLKDLYTWNHFFLSGRIHKPLYTIKSNTTIEAAIRENRDRAVLLSLLVLNQEIVSLKELFQQICKLSYNGDIRTLGAENPNKINNIVNGNYQSFKALYADCAYLDIRGEFAYVNLEQVMADFEFLPSDLIDNISEEDYYKVRKTLKNLRRKNTKESIIHPLKQVMVSGVGTSYQYFKEKHQKKHLK